MAKRSWRWREAGGICLRAAPWVALAIMAARWPRRRKDLPALSNPVAAPPVSFEIAEPGRGRLAEHPKAIPLRGWGDILWRTWREVMNDRLTAVAGGVTFYALLAIFPAIGVFVSLYGLFADVAEVQRQMAQFAMILPRAVLEVVGDQMTRLAGREPASLSAAFGVSLLLSVWSANAGMKSLFDGLNVAYEETERRNWLTRTLVTYGFTLAALLFLTLVALILVAIPLLLKRLGAGALEMAWLPLRWAVLFAIASAGFAMLYRYGPCRSHARWAWVRAGGMLAAAIWLGGSLVFSWYVNNMAHYDATYGSLGAVIGFMMWVWFSVLAILIGAELNSEIEHQTAQDSTTGAPLPMGRRGAAMADTVGLAFRLDAAPVLRRLHVLLIRARRRPWQRAPHRSRA